MQPTPLTGTATNTYASLLVILVTDAAHTPHGDGNIQLIGQLNVSLDAAHTPHGDGSGHEGRGKYQSGKKHRTSDFSITRAVFFTTILFGGLLRPYPGRS